MSSHPIKASPETLVVHGDDGINKTTDVAPALHVSTTFRYDHDPDKLVPALDEDVGTIGHWAVAFH
jgi:cystathionine gamma-synthase